VREDRTRVSERALHRSGVCVCVCARAFELAMSNVGIRTRSSAEVSSEQQWSETVSEIERVYARTITTCTQRNCGAASSSSHLSTPVVDQCALALAINSTHLTSSIVASGAWQMYRMARVYARTITQPCAALPPHRMTCMTLAMLPVPHRTQP
jgi:hypothetical protein